MAMADLVDVGPTKQLVEAGRPRWRLLVGDDGIGEEPAAGFDDGRGRRVRFGQMITMAVIVVTIGSSWLEVDDCRARTGVGDDVVDVWWRCACSVPVRMFVL